MALHLPTGPLKTCSGLVPVRRCEPSTYQPISNYCSVVEHVRLYIWPITPDGRKEGRKKEKRKKEKRK